MSKQKRTLKKIVINSEDSEFSADSSQSYDSNMSPENISRPIYSEGEEDVISENQSLTCTYTKAKSSCTC
jgi:hypothetical protein